MVIRDTYVSKRRIYRRRTITLFMISDHATSFSSLDRIILLLAAIIVLILGRANLPVVDCPQSSEGVCSTTKARSVVFCFLFVGLLLDNVAVHSIDKAAQCTLLSGTDEAAENACESLAWTESDDDVY